ncbi:hypothetical protein B0O80DRAFT_122732 [Mortierella sp. GBAus27b]|nr:hypothetical protein BGX31_002956 [Mortierella sp. GBA43]KAI8351109.1 hypothetical protein B0O80DRAFT_122732 [Mortierella sp. GBAus27b]
MSFFDSQWGSTLVELPTLTFHDALLPLSIFAVLDGIRVSMLYRRAIEKAADQSLKDGTGIKSSRVSWGQGLLSILIMALGGGSSTSLLLGMPPSWLGSNVIVPSYALSYFLIHYTILYDILNEKVPPTVLGSILGIAEASLRALSISRLGVDGSRMRFAADSHNGSTGDLDEPWFAMLLLGVIAGSGGGMWADALKLNSHHWTLSTPSFVHFATYDMKASLLSSFFYAASTSPQFYRLLRSETDTDYSLGQGGLLETQNAKAMTILVMCTLKLGQQVEPIISQYTGFGVSPSGWISTTQTVTTSKKDDHEPEDSHRALRRRADHAQETETEDGEEEAEEPVKKGRGRKASTSKRLMSPTRAASTSSETPLVRSTRARKSARKDL